MIRFATDSELKNWNKLVAKNPDEGHILQTYEWGEYKNQYKWRPLRLIFESGSDKIAVTLLAKNVRGMGRVYYCPKGPGLFADFKPTVANQKLFRTFTREVKRFLNKQDKKGLILIIEPEVLRDSIDLTRFGYDKFRRDIQHTATILVDINKSPEDLLSSFKQKTRYNINLAKRRNVAIENRPPDKNMVDLMYKLMQATQKRAGFFLRPKEAFATYWQSFANAGMAQFLVATHEKDDLAAEFVMIFNNRAYYKEGGSFEIKRNLMGSYLLRYEAMLWAHEHGAKLYDLMGVPPHDKMTPAHPFFSLYQFKAGFSPEVTEFVGCYNLVLNPRARVWLKTERYYNAIYSRIKKNLYY